MKRIVLIVSAFAAGAFGCANASDVGFAEAAHSEKPPKKPRVLCRVTGGGQIVAGLNPDSFGGNAQPFRFNGNGNSSGGGINVDGEWNHVTHDGGHFHGDPDSIECFTVYGAPADPPSAPANAAMFGGLGTWNGEDGCSFTVYVEDHGEPGTNDFYSIEITCPSSASYGADNWLLNGNIQIHDVPPGHLPQELE